MIKTVYNGIAVGGNYHPANVNIIKAFSVVGDLLAIKDSVEVNVYLSPEPDNAFDRNAIKVMLYVPEALEPVKVGYIPNTVNADLLGIGRTTLEADFDGFAMSDGRVVGVNVRVTAPSLEP